jgi:adenylate kinase
MPAATYLILFGPPGCGKGTQAALLARHLAIPALSTGDMLRAQASTGTPRGQAIKFLIDEGYLVPDELVNHMLFDRLEEPDCAHGAILDGYPRTVEQAKAFDRWLGRYGKKLKLVINMAVDAEALVARRAGRLYAPGSRRVYHTQFNPPRVAGKCDETGETLVRRTDDQPDVVRHRLEAYAAVTEPVLAYYQASGRVKNIDGMASIDDVTAAIQGLV